MLIWNPFLQLRYEQSSNRPHPSTLRFLLSNSIVSRPSPMPLPLPLPLPLSMLLPLPCLSCCHPVGICFCRCLCCCSHSTRQKAWVPHLRRGIMRLRWECIPSISQLLPLFLFLLLLLFLRLLVLFQTPITNVISTEGGALCRRSGEIPVFRLCLCLCLCLCCCCCCCCC